jgi:predicted nucleic acid-binding protein
MSAPLLVADSGPLIALARLDLLELPSRLFSEALVTATVWDEVSREPRPADQPRGE